MMTMAAFSEHFPLVYAGYHLLPDQDYSVPSISSHYHLLLVFHDFHALVLVLLVLVFLAMKVDATSISISSREHHDVFGKVPR
jgi:uncharacterized membrane protein YozB (DUF420 family)